MMPLHSTETMASSLHEHPLTIKVEMRIQHNMTCVCYDISLCLVQILLLIPVTRKTYFVHPHSFQISLFHDLFRCLKPEAMFEMQLTVFELSKPVSKCVVNVVNLFGQCDFKGPCLTRSCTCRALITYQRY